MKRNVLVAALALALAGAAHAATTEFTIYKQPGFRGSAQTIKGEVAQLEGGFSKEASSLVVRGGYWEVCTDHHFQGDCHVLAEGDYPRLSRDLDERIVSVRYLGTDERHARRVERRNLAEAREERREWREADRGSVDLYGASNFRGASVRLEGRTPDLGATRFDGRASSVVVRGGTWQFCSEPGYAGRCEVLGPGRYPHLAALDDRISSVRPVR